MDYMFGGVFGGMGPGFRNFLGMGFGTELLYSFFIIACSLMIYFSTKELYELSSYNGIKYFRLAFLFFAIAYFFRTFIKFIVLYFNQQGLIDLNPVTLGLYGILTQFLFIYFSSMAIFYILYSVIFKKFKNKILLFHIIALIFALVSIITVNPIVYLGFNLILLFIVLFVIYINHKSKNKLYIIYVLLSLFWVMNILDILIPKFFNGFQLFIYLASTLIFLIILYKVIKNTGLK